MNTRRKVPYLQATLYHFEQRLKKQGGHTLHQPRGVTITVGMRTVILPGRYQATMDSCVSFVRPHQHGIADSCRGGFFQTPLSDSSKLLIYYFVSSVNTLLKRRNRLYSRGHSFMALNRDHFTLILLP